MTVNLTKIANVADSAQGRFTSVIGSVHVPEQAGFLGGAGPLVIFNIRTSNLFSAVIDLGREHIGMLFIQTFLLWRDRNNVFGGVRPQFFMNK